MAVLAEAERYKLLEGVGGKVAALFNKDGLVEVDIGGSEGRRRPVDGRRSLAWSLKGGEGGEEHVLLWNELFINVPGLLERSVTIVEVLVVFEGGGVGSIRGEEARRTGPRRPATGTLTVRAQDEVETDGSGGSLTGVGGSWRRALCSGRRLEPLGSSW